MIPIDEQIAIFLKWDAGIAACDNVGRSADGRDLYTRLDGLLAEMTSKLPPMACGDGCNLCCYSPPLVTSLEYAVVHRALLAAPLATQQAVITMAERWRPMAKALDRHRWLRVYPSEGQSSGMVLQCPFLVNGSCAVYAARPLICRGYGMTMYGDDDGPSLFACDLAKAHFDTHFVPQGPFALPAFNMYEDHLNRLNQQVQGEKAFLPQWLWAHLDDGRLRPEVNLHPDFDAACERDRSADA